MALGRAPKIISEIKEYIQDLKRNHADSQMPISDDSVPLHKLCAKVEYMLQIDMKPSARSGMFAGKKDYWDYIYQCLYKVKGLDDGIRFVRSKSEVKTSLGRGRAFIRYSLAHHRLGDSLQQCFNNQKVTSTWYTSSSLLLNPSMYSPLISDLYDLNDIPFDLAPSGHDLDAAWPTHSRHSMLPTPGMYTSWQPPSRTESLSSLSSQPSTLDSYPSPTSESRPSIGQERALQLAQTELEECEQVNRELRKRIISLEKDNDEMHRLAMETEERLSGMQSELERKVQQLQYELDKSSKESSEVREDTSRLEKEWQKKVVDVEKANSDLCSRLEAVNLQHASEAKLWQEAEREHQTKLIEADRVLGEIKVQLMGAQSEVQAGKAAEVKREATERTLEQKVSTLEGRNEELLRRMEGMVESKDAEVANHLQSANKVHELLDKLAEAESRNLELKSEKDTLSRRVSLLEDSRSSQEKEMVIKVAELEEKLVQKETEYKAKIDEINTKGQDHEHSVQELKESVSALKGENEKLECRLAEHVKLVESSKIIEETKENELVVLRTELVSVQQKISEGSRDMERLRKELHAAGVKNEELRARMKHTEDVCQERQREIDDLDAEVKACNSKAAERDKLHEEEKERTANLEKQLEEKHIELKKISSEQNEVKGLLENVENILSSTQTSGKTRESIQKNSVVDSTESLGLFVREQLKILIAEKGDALEMMNNVQSENERLQSEVQMLRAKSTAELENATHTAGAAERTKAEVLALKEKLDSMGRTLENKEKSLQGQSIEVQKLERKLKEAEEEKEQVELDVARIRLAIDNKDKERDVLITDMTKLEDERDCLRDDLEAGKRDAEKFNKRSEEQAAAIAQLMSDVEHLKGEKEDAEKGRDNIQKQLDRERQNCRELEDTVEDLKRLQEESISLEQVYEERKTKMTQEHADKVEFLTEQFQLLKEEQEKTSGERLHYQEQAETLGRELDEMKEKCEVMESESVAVRDKNKDLNLEILRLQEEVEMSRTERNEISEQLEQVSRETSHSLQETKEKLQETQVEVERLQGRVQEGEEQGSTRIQQLQDALDVEEKKAKEAETRAQGAEEETQRVKSTLEGEISALRFQLSSEAMQYQHTLQGYEEQEGEVQHLKAKSEEQEHLIDALNSEIAALKLKMDQDKANLQKKLSEQENEIGRQQQQIIIHQDSVEEFSKCMEEERKRSASLQVEVTELKNENGSQMASLESELAVVKDDNEQLKKQLIKLIREKDTLWQRTEKLEYHRKMKASERWLEDRQVTQCMLCLCEFSLTVRKHHCRLCGRIFCAKCANFFVLTSHSKKKSRVCEKCFVGHQHSLEAASINTSIISTNSNGDEDTDHPHPPGEGEGEGEGEFPGGEVMSDDATSDMMSESLNSEPVTMEDVEECLRVIDEKSAASQPGSAGSREEPCAPSPTPPPEKTASEPDFDIISEDEVTAARRNWKEDEDGEKGEDESNRPEVESRLLTIAELEGEGVVGEEAVVAAYQRHPLPVAIDEVGLMLCWEFVSSPKSIGFLVTFHDPSAESPSPAEELIPLCRCNSHQHAVQGELLARKPGVYTLIFDNKFSRFTSKTIKYTLHIKRPEAAY